MFSARGTNSKQMHFANVQYVRTNYPEMAV